jgi:formate hydrogenlyase transcriptional activator
MPPLRERLEDIPALVAHFAAKYAERFKRPIQQIEEESLHRLQTYSWPGNVRELENVVERAVILASQGVLRIPRDMLTPAEHGPLLAAASPMEEQLRLSEKEAIETALKVSRGKIAGASGAAKRLGMPASTLEFRIKKLAVDKYRFRNGR